MAITPYLYDQDVARAMTFLSKAFGFKRFGAKMTAADGSIAHAAMRIGEDVVMMGGPGRGYRNPSRLEQATQSLLVTVDDVDRHFERARKAGASILQEPTDTPFGQRRYGAIDPEGHEWYFAQVVVRGIGAPFAESNEREPGRSARSRARPGGSRFTSWRV